MSSSLFINSMMTLVVRVAEWARAVEGSRISNFDKRS